MKKHLIAAAVAGALAVPAMAQVTVSGFIETGFASVEKSTTLKQTGINAADNGSMTGTPNITFSASEDLGGGLTAGATIQKVFEAGPGTEPSDFKVAKISLSGGFGTIAIGRDSDNAQEAGASYRFFGDVGRTSLRTGTWQTNTIQYTSPSFSGFTVGLFTQMQGDTAANTDDAKANSIIVKGSIGALNLGVSSQNYTAAAAAANTSGVDDKRTNVSASYDLGMAKVGVAYFELKDGSQTDQKSKMTGVHVAVPLSSALSVGIARNQYKEDADKVDTTHLAAKYALSKRTSLNFAYETVKTGASGVPGGVNDSGATNGLKTQMVAGETTKGYGFSISHSF
jgi:predicted porin